MALELELPARYTANGRHVPRAAHDPWPSISAQEAAMHAHDLAALLSAHRRQERLYTEFLRVPALSAGLYVLPAGGTDPQQPHSEDEIYYVVSGRASIQVGGEDRRVAAGSFVYVPTTVPHHFHTIEEELVILVCFAPAEYSNRPASTTETSSTSTSGER
jgi:mannose-6-phosphate isomerase-like protein (cupin superfamily)